MQFERAGSSDSFKWTDNIYRVNLVYPLYDDLAARKTYTSTFKFSDQLDWARFDLALATPHQKLGEDEESLVD